jgi:hypothetical protein
MEAKMETQISQDTFCGSAEMVSTPASDIGRKNSSKSHMTALINSGAINHNNAMTRFGLIGAAAGSLVGICLVPNIPGRESMFPVILPIATTMFGLSLGFFIAGLRKAALRESSTTTNIEVDGAVHALFANSDEAARAFDALKNLGVATRQITLIGEDSDELRQATSTLHQRKLDRLILMLGGLGAVVGAIWSILCCPQLDGSLPSAIFSAAMACFCGVMLGLLTGGFIGAIVHLDNGPATDTTIIEGTVNDGFAAVVIKPDNPVQRGQIVDVLAARKHDDSPLAVCHAYEEAPERISA